MATILLSAAGAAIGGSIGGTVAGLSTAVIGRAVGATLGQVIDQRLLGQGAEPVETGKVDRFRLTQTGEGAPISQVFGRSRVGGQVIWASDFRETSTSSGGGGKGSPATPEVTTYSYSVSLAIALCEGEITTVGRVWADGEEFSRDDINLRIYTGTSDQLPDPMIEAVEGSGNVPAYRGTAYVVIEDLALAQFGNRVPQFSFEVLRGEQPDSESYEEDLKQLIKGVALMPGTGEYSLAKSPVYYSSGPGSYWPANINSPSGKSDFETSFEHLREELPNCDGASLIVSWFGSDLRCSSCEIRPKIERHEYEGSNMPWSVAGVSRTSATTTPRNDGEPVYGGTPADAAVVESIQHMNDLGQRVMFYPFILMEQGEGNGLEDPWSGEIDQPVLPWRGRITLSKAPGQNASPDGTAFADAEVDQFFGAAKAEHFSVGNGSVTYSGPQDWGLCRFILHYAALCASAGGVSSFCISSEMRGLTQIRGANGFPAVARLKNLAAEVRLLLGPDTKIGYAADWSEYFGYQPQDGSNDRFFHLDPLWADDNIDFVGIDNYMPLSDWRDGDEHVDAREGAIYSKDYLQANIEGGEGYDWFYGSDAERLNQIRQPIQDAEHDEPWVWRFKDIRNWWGNSHFERVAGVRQPEPTDWIPQSKPIWFTELGCAAIDKATNQPNKFLDPKSSESSLPNFSNGLRDDFIQHQYLQVTLGYWATDKLNPVSEVDGRRMVDTSSAFVWAWDTRPFPRFPNNRSLWSDGTNYARGHWLNGRTGARTLSSVVEEICRKSGLFHFDTSRLFGMVQGYVLDQVADARSALQPLMLRYGFDAVERDGVLKFVSRSGRNPRLIESAELAESGEIDEILQLTRDAEAEITGRVRVRFVQAGADYDIVSEEAVLADSSTHSVSSNELQLSMTRAEGRQVAERWLSEARISRDTARFALPLSSIDVGAGDVIRLCEEGFAQGSLFRVDRVEHTHLQTIDAVRIESDVYLPSEMADDLPGSTAFVPPVPVFPLFLDLPLITGDEVPHAPHLAVTAQPWPGTVAIYESGSDSDYRLGDVISRRATIGQTETAFKAARPGLWDEGEGLRVKLLSGGLETKPLAEVLNGANLAAIGDGSPANWELFQFADAELVEKDTYNLTRRLRGQLGSDTDLPKVWPQGSWFVLLNQVPEQIKLTSAQRRMERHYRIGPARRGNSDPSYRHYTNSFDGVGLRPYAPCHLKCEPGGDGNKQLTWVRRTRIDGDSWDLPDVPLGEELESYIVRIMQDDSVIRENVVHETSWSYSAAQQVADGVVGRYSAEVAQVSALFGPGPFAKVDLLS